MDMISRAWRSTLRLAGISAVIAAASACGVEKQSAPALTGPSEFGTAITLTASPDTLARDGVSQSVITIVARDGENRPIANLPLTVFADTGFLSAEQVTTGSNGVTTVVFTAPELQTVVNTAVVRVVPVGTNSDNSVSRNVAISLLAPAAANPSFTVSPANPQAFQNTVLDASATTLGGQACGDACTYSWNLGGEATATGRIISYRFQTEAAYVVTLSVTSPGGVTTQTQRTVNVGAAVAPTASFTFSPANPQVNDTVRFNGNSSTGSNGATIVSWEWDFGNGQQATGATPSTTFPLERTYIVRLTVTDSRGQRATVTQQVAVINP